MPRNVRNFWFEASVDGRANTLSSGPVRADGGMDITILVREHGTISEKTLRIACRSLDGQNILSAWFGDKEVFSLKVER